MRSRGKLILKPECYLNEWIVRNALPNGSSIVISHTPKSGLNSIISQITKLAEGKTKIEIDKLIVVIDSEYGPQREQLEALVDKYADTNFQPNSLRIGSSQIKSYILSIRKNRSIVVGMIVFQPCPEVVISQGMKIAGKKYKELRELESEGCRAKLFKRKSKKWGQQTLTALNRVAEELKIIEFIRSELMRIMECLERERVR